MTLMRYIAGLALYLVAAVSIATCEPPQTEQSPYKRLDIKRPAEYRPLVSMTGSKP